MIPEPWYFCNLRKVENDLLLSVRLSVFGFTVVVTSVG